MEDRMIMSKATPLKVLRVTYNLRQKDVADLAQIPQPRYSQLERGVYNPREEELERLGQVFGLNDMDRWFKKS
jgi:transcriptional regulator with XRE-family HTH domain